MDGTTGASRGRSHFSGGLLGINVKPRPTASSAASMSNLGSRGPWKKLQAIGKGSFGLVFLVERDGRKFVMKEVNLRGLSRAEMISAQNEVAVLKKVKHPHAIAIEDALVVDDTLCIVMEWAQGKDLGALIAQRKKESRPFTEEEVLKIFWQLSSCLAHCHHELHMLHRDLKVARHARAATPHRP